MVSYNNVMICKSRNTNYA